MKSADVGENFLELEGHGLDLQVTGLDLREVQDVVDDAEQVLPGQLNLRDVVALPCVELGPQRQVCHPDDGVHRRANLMAHVGQEVRLHARRLFGHLLGAAQLLLDLLQFCNDAAGERVEPILRLLDQLTVRVRPCQLLLKKTNLPLEALDALHGVGIRGIGHGRFNWRGAA